MQKSDWYKLLAIGIVAAFVIEGVAIGMLSSGSQAQQQPQDQQGTTGESLLGSATMNLTVLKYEPYLIVKGGGEEADRVKQSLIDRGIATYAVPSGDSIIVNLNSSKHAVIAGAEFEAANASVTAQISYSMPAKVLVQGGPGVSAEVEGATFKVQGRPIYDEGSVLPATMAVQVENGAIIGIGNLNILPESVSGAVVDAEIVGEPAGSYSVEVPWEARVAAKPVVSAAGATYRQKSYVFVPLNATTQQLDAIKLYSYVTGSQPGIVSVQNDFVNVSRATDEFVLARMPPVFPASTAAFANDSEGKKATALAASLSEAGIAADVVSRTTAKAKLPETIEKDGKTYYTGGKVLDVEVTGTIAKGGTVRLLLDFTAAGSSIGQITSVKQAS